MARNTFSLYIQNRGQYPQPYFFKCYNCNSKVYTDLYMDYDYSKEQIVFFRQRFCNCKPDNNQKLQVAKIDEKQTPILTRTLIE